MSTIKRKEKVGKYCKMNIHKEVMKEIKLLESSVILKEEKKEEKYVRYTKITKKKVVKK